MIFNIFIDYLSQDVKCIEKYGHSRDHIQFMIKNKNIIPVYPIGRFQGDIVIGTPFISQFNYTVFDYDDKSISIYSDWIHIENRKTISQAALMCCFIVFNCMAIAIVFNLKNKVNNLY